MSLEQTDDVVSPEYREAAIRILALQREKVRRMCRYIPGEPGRGMFNLAKHVLGYDRLLWHRHGDLCARLETMYWGHSVSKSSAGHVIQDLELWPRSTYKTTLVTVSFPIWIMLLDDPPDLGTSGVIQHPRSFNGKPGYDQRILIACATLDDSNERLGAIITQFESNPEIVAKFGQLAPQKRTEGLWTKDQMSVTWRRSLIQKEPNIRASAPGAATAGQHYDIALGDDLINEKNVTNEEMVEKAKAWHRQIQPVLDPPKSLLIYIGTRWHDSDLYGYLIDEEKDHISVTVKEAERDEDEIAAGMEPLGFPEILTREMLDALKEKMTPWFYNAQYNNRIIDQSDAHFRKSYFDGMEFELPLGHDLADFLEGKVVITTTDPAISKDKRGCHWVTMTAAWDHNGHVWVLDLFRQRGVKPKDGIEEIFRQDISWKPVSNGIEQEGFQAVLQWACDEYSRDIKHFPSWAILKSNNRSKEVRIESLEPYARGRRIHWQKKHAAMIEEFLRYPRGRYRDAIDAFAYQLDLAFRGKEPKPDPDKGEDPLVVYARKQHAARLTRLRISGNGSSMEDWYNI